MAQSLLVTVSIFLLNVTISLLFCIKSCESSCNLTFKHVFGTILAWIRTRFPIVRTGSGSQNPHWSLKIAFSAFLDFISLFWYKIDLSKNSKKSSLKIVKSTFSSYIYMNCFEFQDIRGQYREKYFSCQKTIQ